MKFSAAAVLFATSLVSSRAQLTSPALGECLGAETISDFAECFVANSKCLDETTIGQVRTCVDTLDPPPTDVFAFIRSGCLDYVTDCVQENAPDFGSLSAIGIPIPILDACKDSETIEDVLKCVALNANFPCVDETTISDIETCIGGITPPEDIRGLIQDSDCFDGVKECVQGQVEEFVGTLPLCIPETMRELGQCINDNMELCLESCRDTSAPVMDLEAANLESCTGFQAALVTPICGAIACCQPCVEPFQAATECILSELVTLEEDCDFNCPIVPTRRQLFFDRIKEWFDNNKNNDEEGADLAPPTIGLPEPLIFGQCFNILRMESEEEKLITEQDVAEFLECVSQVIVNLVSNGPIQGGHSALRGVVPGN